MDRIDDLISRQAALKSQITMIAQGLDWIPAYHIEQLPSAERHGRWIEQEADMDTIYECSVCGEPFVTIDGTPADNLWHYCPNCGAKMEVK